MRKRLIKLGLILLCGVCAPDPSRQEQRELLEYEAQLDGINVENIYDTKDEESLKKMLGHGAVWVKADEQLIEIANRIGFFNIFDLKNMYDKNKSKILGSTITNPITFNSLEEIQDFAKKMEKNEGVLDYAYLLFFNLSCKTIEEFSTKGLSSAESSPVQSYTILRFDYKGFFFSSKLSSFIFENTVLRARKNKASYTVTRDTGNLSKVLQKLEQKMHDEQKKYAEAKLIESKKHTEALEIIRKEAVEREAAAKLREATLIGMITSTREEAARHKIKILEKMDEKIAQLSKTIQEMFEKLDYEFI